MELTIKNYKTKLSEDLIKKSQRCEVRECDEIVPGHFESYIDEMDQTYDVKLTFEKSIVNGHICDCESAVPFCQHKIALLAFLGKGAKPAVKVMVTKKVDPLVLALEGADQQKLRDWILKTLKKNKHLGISFINEFSNNLGNQTPAEIVSLTNDAVKAVINKRERAETSEVKKIVDLWTELHKPILERYYAEPTNADYFAQVHAIINTVYNFRYQIQTNSKRFDTYLQPAIDSLKDVVCIIKDDASWIKCITYFSSELFLDYGGIRRAYTNLLIRIFNESSNVRRSEITRTLIGAYQTRKKNREADAKELLQLLLRIAVANEEFEVYKDVFTPIKHAYAYNLQIIDSLLDIGSLELAESYCLGQINLNTNAEYDSGYISRLRHIYLQTNNEAKLLSILAKELLIRPNFDDYLVVADGMPHDANFKKWRNQLLANARQLSAFDKDSADFCLALRHVEGDIKGLLAYIDDRSDYDSIMLYAGELLDVVPDQFMKKLAEKPESHRDAMLAEEAPKEIDETLYGIYNLCVTKLGVDTVRPFVAQQQVRYRGWVNLFVKYAVIKLKLIK